LEFTSVTFESGSALLAPATKSAVRDLAAKLKRYMDENNRMEILIEGHTDPAAIKQVINRGGYFSDNIQLSTLRAANVRAELLTHLGTEYAKRIGVAGYGETRLRNTQYPLSPENRRIEIRILWNGQKEKKD
jgi:chemotaxis protein MotB